MHGLVPPGRIVRDYRAGNTIDKFIIHMEKILFLEMILCEHRLKEAIWLIIYRKREKYVTIKIAIQTKILI